MKILVEVDCDKEFPIQPDDWKKLKNAKKDIEDYIRLRGYNGKISFQLDSNGGDLYVELENGYDIFKNVDLLVRELSHCIPGFIFEPEED